MPIQTQGIVLKNDNIKSIYYLLEIKCPDIASIIKPGQFIMLKVSDNHSPLLRRPFSLFRTSSLNIQKQKNAKTFSIIYKIVGKGTKMMTKFKKGDKLDIIGPLGNGFHPPSLLPPCNIFLIGGGVGIATLFPVSEMLKDYNLFIFIGGKTQNDILCVEEFRNKNSKIFISTEDGSLGFKGTVIDLFLFQVKRMRFKKPLYVYTCGPSNMLKKLAKITKFQEIHCQASFESRLGCGFGACWGCVVKTKNSISPYQRVCKDGPVFDLNQIVWEDE
jgi:dihydroorotate dehydrogenase electron transfer subunit